MIKTLIANQNPSCFKALKHFKRQMSKLQPALIINGMLLCVGLDTIEVIDIDIALGVNRP